MRGGLRVGIGVGLLLLAGTVFAQTGPDGQTQAAAKRLTFVQATVKLSAPRDLTSPQPGQARIGVYVEGQHVAINYQPVRALIMLAYKVKQYQIAGLSMLNDRQYDISATMPEGATVKDLPAMLQALLEDRFKLTAHREDKERSVLALTVKKGGPKLKESTVEQATVPSGPLKPMEMRVTSPEGPVDIVTDAHQTVSVESDRMDMAGLADLLTRLLHGGNGNARQDSGLYENDSDWRVVVDRTGLTGEYQVAVNSSLNRYTVALRVEGAIKVDSGRPITGNGRSAAMWTGGPNAPVGDELDSTLLISLESLGLKLEKSKAPVEQLVVDHLEKNPAEN